MQQHAGEQRDQHRPDVDEHRRRACIDPLLRRVEQHVVGREPEQPACEQPAEIAARRQRVVARGDEQAQHRGGDEQAPERQRTGGDVLAGGADADERRRPEHDGDERRGEGEPLVGRPWRGGRGTDRGGIGHPAHGTRGTVRPEPKPKRCEIIASARGSRVEGELMKVGGVLAAVGLLVAAGGSAGGRAPARHGRVRRHVEDAGRDAERHGRGRIRIRARGRGPELDRRARVQRRRLGARAARLRRSRGASRTGTPAAISASAPPRRSTASR